MKVKVKKIGSTEVEERPIRKIEKGTQCLVDDSTPFAQFELSDRDGTGNMGKDIRILITGKHPFDHTEES